MWCNIYTAVQSLEILPWMCYEGTQTADRRAGKAVSGKDKRGGTELAERSYKLKQCSLCGKNFKPHSSAAKYCPQCHPKMLRLWAERSANNAKLGVSPTTLSQWLAGKSTFSDQRLREILDIIQSNA